jgi:hypothetical protein
MIDEEDKMPLSAPPLGEPFQLSRLPRPGLEANPDEPALGSAEPRRT